MGPGLECCNHRWNERSLVEVGLLLVMKRNQIPIEIENSRSNALASIRISSLRFISRINGVG